MKKPVKKSLKSQNDTDSLYLNWKSVINAISTPAQIIDKNHQILAVNEATLKYFNFKQEDLISKKCSAIFLNSETPPHNCPLNVVTKDNKSLSDIVAIEINNAKHTISCAPIYNTEGNFEAVLHIITDISQSISVENLLKKSEEKFRSFFNNSPDIQTSVSPINAQILECNDTLLKKTGYTREEIIGTPIFNMYHNDCLEEAKKVFQQFLQTGKVSDKELILKTKNGDKIDVSLNINAVRDEAGKILYSISTWRDVSEAKKAEKEILNINKELKTLNKIIIASVSCSELKEILDIFLKEAIQIVGLEGGTICLVEPNDTLKLISHIETSEATLKDFAENSIKVGDCLCGNCAHDNCPLILNNREEVLKYATRETLREEEIYFHAAFPITSKEKCLGVLCVFTRTDLKPKTRKLKLLETLTTQVALAVENILLIQNLENSIKKRTFELEEKNEKLNRMNQIFVGRELRMKELKEEIKTLKKNG